jgi:hypothetical protein
MIMLGTIVTLALGSRPKQGLARVQTKSDARGSHFMLSRGWECRRLWENEHSNKWAPILGIGVLVDSRIFIERLEESKPIGLKSSLYHWKALGTQMSKVGSHDPFGHLKHKLWPKEGPIVKLAVWLPTTKSQESTQFPYVKVTCDILLEISWRWLQIFFRSHLNWRFEHKVMGPQSCGNPNFGNFRTPIWESRDKMPFGCGFVERHKV